MMNEKITSRELYLIELALQRAISEIEPSDIRCLREWKAILPKLKLIDVKEV
ncbi:hypothetical protein ACFQ3Y_09140 [Paenibacillus motobuensis]|uniref:hypothetical protein n=1 Tax=Paenibacillus motobuensis TaxID=295324 RepID=UPI003632D61D